LWRCSNPALAEKERERLVQELMSARSMKGQALQARDAAALEGARQRVDAAKHALGERGEPWWTDGAPDYNRHLAKNSPYAAWFPAFEDQDKLQS
jgi:predicted aminopeptidase